MSNAVFPTLPGLAWSVGKTPEFSTIVKQAANGAETRIALWSAPRWHFKLKYELLRDDVTNEFKTLAGFFLQRQGQYDDFLFLDPSDNQAIGQQLGIGDGVTKTFQCVRTFGGFVEPIRDFGTAPALTVKINGAVVSTGWSVTSGVITFATAPAVGAAVTADFSFYFRVRFAADLVDFEQFMLNLWNLKTCELVSVK